MKIYCKQAFPMPKKRPAFCLHCTTSYQPHSTLSFTHSTHGRNRFLRTEELFQAYRRDSTDHFVVCSWGKV